jgi:hypothetical protein
MCPLHCFSPELHSLGVSPAADQLEHAAEPELRAGRDGVALREDAEDLLHALRGGSVDRRALLRVGCPLRTGGRKTSYQIRIGGLDLLNSKTGASV